MKRTKWMAALCILLSVLTVGGTFAKYVTTVSNDFVLDIIAQVYTLTLDANGGYFPPDSSFQEKETIISHTQTGSNKFGVRFPHLDHGINIFMGWAEDPSDGHVDYEKGTNVIFVTKPVTYLYAIWGTKIDVLTNQSSGNDTFTVTKSADGGTLTLDLKLKDGNYERLFIPLPELDPESVYQIDFDYSGSGLYHNYEFGMFGWNVVDPATEKKYASSIKNLKLILDGEGASATNYWNAMEDMEFFVEKATPDSSFDFGYTHQSKIFPVFDTETMYLFLEYSNVLDGSESFQYLDNLKLTKLENAVPVAHVGGTISNNSDYFELGKDYNFTMKSLQGHYERFGFRIPVDLGLQIGQKYKVSFDFENDATLGTYGSAYFGYAIDKDKSILNNANSKTQENYWNPLQSNTNAYYEKEFEATDENMYMLFELSLGKDGNTANYKLKNFKIEPVSDTLEADDVIGETAEPLSINIDGIDDEGFTNWHTVENQNIPEPFGDRNLPYAGYDFSLAFPLSDPENFAMPEAITVQIDDTTYQVNTNGTNPDGEPYFDPETATLTIPGTLLKEGSCITVTAKAVPIELEASDETAPPDGETTAPEDGVADPEGEAAQPNGEGDTTQPDGEITDPENGTVTPEDGTDLPSGENGTDTPDGETTNPEGDTAKPGEEITTPEDDTVIPEGETAVPEGEATTPAVPPSEGETAVPEPPQQTPEQPAADPSIVPQDPEMVITGAKDEEEVSNPESDAPSEEESGLPAEQSGDSAEA